MPSRSTESWSDVELRAGWVDTRTDYTLAARLKTTQKDPGIGSGRGSGLADDGMCYKRWLVAASSAPPSSDSLETKLQRLVPLGEAPRAFLLVLQGPRAGRLHLLGDQDMLIGRSDSADIPLKDSAVSHDHARITRRPDGYHLVDLDSRNGTLLNGVLISERRLRKRDRIQVGETTLVFLEEGPTESTLTVAVNPDDDLGNFRGAPHSLQVHARQSRLTPFAYAPLQEDLENPFVQLVRKLLTLFRFIRRNAWVLVPLPVLGLALGAYSVKLRPPPETAQAAVKLTQLQQRNPVGHNQYFMPQGPNTHIPAAFFDEPEKNFANPELVKITLLRMGLNPSESLVRSTFTGLRFDRDFAAPAGVYVAQFAQAQKSASELSSTAFLEQYLETYLLREVDKSIRVLKSEAEFMEAELAKVETELQQVADELSSFRSKHIDSLPEQAAAVMSSKLELAQQRAQLEIEIERHRVEVANVRAQMSQTDTVVSRRVEDLKPLEQELASKRRQLSDLKAKGLKADHPEVSHLTSQIEMLDAEMKRKMNSSVSDLERTTDPRQQELSRLLQRHQGDLRVAESALVKINQQLGTAASRVAAVPGVDAKVQALSRQRDSLQQLRGQLFERHREKRVQIDLETANVRARYEMMGPAQLQNPMTVRFLGTRVGGGLIAGLVLALMITALLELRRMVKKHPELLAS